MTTGSVGNQGSTSHSHSYGKWVSNNNGTHTRTCSGDSSHKETKNCSGGTATCTSKAVCKDCGGSYGQLGGHSYSQTWQTNSTQHYHSCQCGQKSGAENHQVIIKNQKPATQTEFGYTGDKVCSVCNYTVERGETIEKLTTGEGGNDPIDGNEGQGEGQGEGAGAGQGCSASIKPINCVGGFVVLVIIMLLVAKKQKRN